MIEKSFTDYGQQKKNKEGVLYFLIGDGIDNRIIGYKELISTKNLEPFLAYLKEHVELIRDYDLFMARPGAGAAMDGDELKIPLLYPVKNAEIITSNSFGQKRVFIKLDEDYYSFDFFEKGFQLESKDNTENKAGDSKKEKNN